MPEKIKEGEEISVAINLIAHVSYGNEAPDLPVQFITTGILSQSNGRTLLSYIEHSDNTDQNEPDTFITLEFSKGTVTMKRNGPFSNEMIFSKGKRFESYYNTPYGDMKMAVYSISVNYTIDKHEGQMDLKYQLDLQGNYASNNELHLQYSAI